MGSVVFVDDAYIAGVTALRSVNLSEVNFIFYFDGKTTGNRLRLTRFLPVNLVFVAACAALGVSFPGACPGKDGIIISMRRQHSHGATLARMFSPQAPLSGALRRSDIHACT